MKEMEFYQDMAQKCVRCGNCQYYCPTFTATRMEPYVARGRLELIKASMDSRRQEHSDTFLRRINQCLLCGNCSQNCPPGIETEKIIEAMRAECARTKGVSAALASVSNNIEKVGNITGDARENRLLWLKNVEGLATGVKINESAEYAYFAGCVPTLYPSAYSIPQAFLKILKASELSFTILGEEEDCCGYPLAIGGLPDKARMVARKNIDRLKSLGIKKVLTTCASCYHMYSAYYPELLGEELGLEVIHSTQLLAELLSAGKLKTKKVDRIVTYHDPCDLGRKSNLFAQPRSIMMNLEGLSLREMKHNGADARCCGGGGNLEMSDPVLSGKVAQERVKEAVNTGAGTIVTACQQCKRTLQTGARQLKARIKVIDICELVQEALDEG